MHARTGDIEIDGVRPAGQRVGVDDRLAKRAGAAVGRGRYHENAVGDQNPVLDRPSRRPTRLADSASCRRGTLAAA